MKIYEFDMPYTLQNIAVKPIRNKENLILLLLKVVKVMTIEPYNNLLSISNYKLILVIDKMSRLFFCLKDKIFTINFPLMVKEKDNQLEFSYDGLVIDSYASSLLISIFGKEGIISKGIEYLYEQITEEFISYELNDNDDIYYELINLYMSFEPGYLRYDLDIDHYVEGIHPLKHLDINYNDNNTFKIGIEDNVEININWMIDFVDIKTNCRFLNND